MLLLTTRSRSCTPYNLHSPLFYRVTSPHLWRRNNVSPLDSANAGFDSHASLRHTPLRLESGNNFSRPTSLITHRLMWRLSFQLRHQCVPQCPRQCNNCQSRLTFGPCETEYHLLLQCTLHLLLSLLPSAPHVLGFPLSICCFLALLMLHCLHLLLTYSPALEASNMKCIDLEIDRL
jgi:hypothetical protein